MSSDSGIVWEWKENSSIHFLHNFALLNHVLPQASLPPPSACKAFVLSQSYSPSPELQPLFPSFPQACVAFCPGPFHAQSEKHDLFFEYIHSFWANLPFYLSFFLWFCSATTITPWHYLISVPLFPGIFSPTNHGGKDKLPWLGAIHE